MASVVEAAAPGEHEGPRVVERESRPPGAAGSGAGPDRPVLQRVLEVADHRAVPTTLRKSTLTELCHTLEDQVLHEDLAAVVIAGFQRARYWDVERERYARLCADPRRRSLVFAADAAPHTEGITYVAVGDEHPLAREWFVLTLTERFSAVLFGRELTAGEGSGEDERAFLTVWSFDPSLVEDLLGLLGAAAEDLDPSVAAALADAAHRHPPRRPASGSTQRFGNAVFERLESQVARWQRANVELQRANEEILHRRARGAELQRLATLGTVAGQLAHRLDTPLSAITLAADGLGSTTDPDERADLLGVIGEQALLAGTLAAELRDRAVPEPMDLIELDLVSWLATEIPALQLCGFDVVAADRNTAACLLATADPDRLSQALLETARVAHRAAGRSSPVRVGLTCRDTRLRLLVQHDGEPPRPDQLAALRAWSGREDLGDRTATALAAARTYLESLAGTLEVEVEEDGVVRFVLTVQAAPTTSSRGVPRPDPAAPAAAHPGDHPQPTGTAATDAVRRVLIADDELAIRGFLEALLRRAGWQVRTASSLASTERALAEGEVEALLLDVNLVGGEVGGRLEALEQVRAGITERTVLLAAEPPSGRRLHGRPVAGKPFVWAELEDALASLEASTGTAL